MSDCNETLREMYRYLDGELADEIKGLLETHLGGCLDCHGAFEFHHVLRETIRRSCTGDIPPGLAARLARCLGEEASSAASAPPVD